MAKNCLVFITVLIGQQDQFQGHMHRTYMYGTTDGGTSAVVAPRADRNDRNRYWYTDRAYYGDAGNGTPRVGDETRPMNLSIKVWQRIS